MNNRSLTASLTSFEKIAEVAHGNGVRAQIARQYMTIYDRAITKTAPTILELGTREGISTSVFLKVCQENGGEVFSVDIDDCSGVSDDPCWHFIQSDSTDVARILAAAPSLGSGIDILLIDSLHTRSHVQKEFFCWYPYLNSGAIVFFDDVDPFIYRKRNRKDGLFNEFNWQEIQDFLIEVFRANEDSMRLSIHFGSSGLAVLEKNAPMGESAEPPRQQVYRTRQAHWRLWVAATRLKARLWARLGQ